MIKLISNYLEGKFAAPKCYPVTFANPMPWLIDEMKIEYSYDNNKQESINKILIRNKYSGWFSVDRCFIGTEQELLKCLCLSPEELQQRGEILKEHGILPLVK